MAGGQRRPEQHDRTVSADGSAINELVERRIMPGEAVVALIKVEFEGTVSTPVT